MRDCARGHILALEKGQTGERYLLSSETDWMVEMGKILHDEYGSKGYKKIVRKEMGNCMFKCISCCVKEAKLVRPWVNFEFSLNNAKAKELGVEFRPLKDSLIDMIPSMIEANTLPNKLIK